MSKLREFTGYDLPSLTHSQEVRFNILVPFYTEMESKRQSEDGNLTKQSAHKIYDRTIAKLDAHYRYRAADSDEEQS